MPSSDSADRRPTRSQHGANHPPEPEQLPCPRCSSTNTKFCYYNNYNLAQPRHYCKSCRRYWTRGGTLRNVPVGGGTRNNHNSNKNNKRPRTAPAEASDAPSVSPSYHLTYEPVHVGPINQIPSYDVNLNEKVPEMEAYGSFVNLNGCGFFGLGSFGAEFREMGFGLGAGTWDMGMEDISSGNGGGGDGAEVGLGDGSCFGLPDLAISTPGEGHK